MRKTTFLVTTVIATFLSIKSDAAPISNSTPENYIYLFGPERIGSPAVGSKTYTKTISANPAPQAAELFIVNGSGRDLSLQNCKNLALLQKFLCTIENAAKTVLVALERPKEIEIKLNDVTLVTRAMLRPQTNSLLIPVTLQASNQLQVKLKGSIFSSVTLSLRGLDHAGPTLTLIEPAEGAVIQGLSFDISGTSDESLLQATAQLGSGPIVNLDLASDARSFEKTVTSASPGVQNLTVKAQDFAGNETTISRQITLVHNRPPTSSLTLASNGTGIAPFTVLFDASESSDPDGDALTYLFDFDDGQSITASSPRISHEFLEAGNYQVEVRVTDTSGASSVSSIQVTATNPVLPQDPLTLAPAISETEQQSFEDTIRFLYEGPGAIQQGVAIGAIVSDRVATISGQVVDQDGQPLSGVKVTSLGKSNLGHTLTRVDGRYDFAVNSGGLTTLKFERNGYTQATRDLDTDRQMMMTQETIYLVRRDTKATEITSSSVEAQVARANPVTDQSGSRQATAVFAPQTTAQLQMPNGTLVSVDKLTVRMTEFTVGENGPKKMPAPLPARSSYTYALELTADEAIAMGAERINFSKPVSFYVDNFLSIPTGYAMPLGYLNAKTGYWEPERDGIVLGVVSHTGGLANIDMGGGQPATETQLLTIGIDTEERRKIASLYQPGASFWRVRLNHFSLYDLNGNTSSNKDDDNKTAQNDQNKEKLECPGCVIDVVSGTMSETIDLPGAMTSLHYTTSRSGERLENTRVTVPVLGDTVPDDLEQIIVHATFGGRTIGQVIPVAPGATAEFTWNGIDVFGRRLYAEQDVQVEIQLLREVPYAFVPYNPLRDRTFGMFFSGQFDAALQVPAREFFTTTTTQILKVRPPLDTATFFAMKEVGRWTLSQHHFFDKKSGNMFMGNGDIRYFNDSPKVVRNFAGTSLVGFAGDGGPANQARFNFPRNFTFDNDGNVLVVDILNRRIRKIDRITNIVTTIAGNGSSTHSGDGGLALNAGMVTPLDITVDRDGNIFFSDYGAHRVRKIATNGIITTVVGTGAQGYSGDGGLAIDAQINSPRSVIANPDGSLYVSEEFNHVIRRIDSNGIISTFAGTGIAGYNGDGGPATEAQFEFPNYTATDSKGNLYVAQSGAACAIRKITPTGIVSTIAGGTCGAIKNGEPATLSPIGSVAAVAVSNSGTVYFADRTNHQIVMIDDSGGIGVVIGTGQRAFNGNNRSGATTNLSSPSDIEVRPDGSLLFIDYDRNVLREYVIAPRRFSTIPGAVEIGSADASEIFVFDQNGRHLLTKFAETGSTKYSFEHDSNGRLITMTDSSGNETRIERSGSGLPSLIRTPFGQNYSLTVSSNGIEENLTSLTFPTGETYRFEYNPVGLLSKFTKPSGGEYTFSYSQSGRLSFETDPTGGYQNLNPSARTTREGLSLNFNHSKDRAGNSFLTTYKGDETYISSTSAAGVRATNSPDSIVTNSTSSIDSRLGGHSTYQARFDVRYLDGGTLFQATDRTYVFSGTEFQRTDRTTTDDGWFQTAFDSTSRTYASTTSEGRVSTTVIDEKTRPVQIQVGGLEPITMNYDTRGRLSRTAQGPRVTEFSYDSSGFLSSVRDALGQVSAVQFDGTQKLISSTNPNGETVGFGYDLDRNLSEIVLPGNILHRISSTLVDLLSGYITPLSRTTGYVYDFDQNITGIQRADGKQVQYTYQENRNRRLQQIQTTDQTIALTYFPRRSLIQFLQTSDGSTIAFPSYNGDRPLQKNYQGPFNSGLSITYYDQGLLPSSMTVGGSNIPLEYNTDRELDRAGDLYLSRDTTSGLLTEKRLGIVREVMSYNGFGEMISRSFDGVAGGDLYLRDALGRITQFQTTIAGAVQTSTYSYDPAGRLSRTVVTGPFATTNEYTYDNRGNRIAVNRDGTVTSAVFDTEDRLLSYGDLRFTYTDHGDLLRKENLVTGESLTLTYDQRGQLTRAQKNNGTVITYTIDGEGRRLTRSVNGVFETGYMHDTNGRLIAEVEPNGALRSHFVYASQSHSPDYMIRSGVKYFFVKSHLGSIRSVVNSQTGASSQQLRYDEFGRVLFNSNPGFQPFGFAGGHFDPETGLVRFGARDYDADVGRWTAKDPSIFLGGYSLYGYSFGDPINLIDPDGRIPTLIAAPIIGGIVGGLVGAVTTALIGGTGSDIAAGFTTGFIGGATAGLGLATGMGAAAATALGLAASALTALPDSGVNPTDIGNGLKRLLEPKPKGCPE